MKKLYFLAAAAIVAFAANAQNGAPLYITGAGEFANGEWNATTPDEFTYADGKYTIEVKNLTQFKISTGCGDWSAFDGGVFGCNYGDTPGVAKGLQPGYTSNIMTPWKGDYTVTVAGNLSTITLTTGTQASVEPISIYLRGGMNSWGAEEDWKFTAVIEGKVYKLPENGTVSIEANTEFKIADADWNKYNYGIIGGLEFNKELTLDYNGSNIAMADAFNGVIWLNLEGGSVIFSTDATYVPAWEGLEGSGVAEIEVNDGVAPRYFNLQGVEVAQPESGLYIMVKGNSTSKVLVK